MYYSVMSVVRVGYVDVRMTEYDPASCPVSNIALKQAAPGNLNDF